jgi:hypothetical protein
MFSLAAIHKKQNSTPHVCVKLYQILQYQAVSTHHLMVHTVICFILADLHYELFVFHIHALKNVCTCMINQHHVIIIITIIIISQHVAVTHVTIIKVS